MILLTIVMAVLVLLLLPIQVGVSAYIDLDNSCVVVLMSIYGIIFFDSIIDTDGTNINYRGSLNGSIAILDIEFVDIDDLLNALQYRSISCTVSTDLGDSRHSALQWAVLSVAAMVTPIVNRCTDTVMTTVNNIGKANYINLSCRVSTTPCAMVGALCR